MTCSLRLSPLLALLALAACEREVPAPAPPAPGPPAAPAASGPAASAVVYHCENGTTLKVTYADQTARFEVSGRPRTLTIARSASGARYVGDGLQWWSKGMDQGRLSILRPGEEVAADPGVTCTTTDPATPVQPPEPGTPGGLPDDRTPISEAPFTPQSAQGAANVVQTYFALLGEKAYARAWKLWSDGGKASGQTSAEAFARTFDRYASYHALVGAPGDTEGAAGSIYVSVPVVIYGRLKSGVEVHEKGEALLRHVNDVPGSTAEQRRWHISQITTRPTP